MIILKDHRLHPVLEYDEAFMFCLCLNYNGQKNWRFPQWDEYISEDYLINCWYDDAWFDAVTKRHVIPVRDEYKLDFLNDSIYNKFF